MTATSANTGRIIGEADRLSQAVSDILLTPLGSRVLKRDYGSLLFELVDQPGNDATLQQLRAATVDALKKWEPSLSISSVSITTTTAGTYTIEIYDESTDGAYTSTLQGAA